jgi:hypothetical protein
MKAKDLAIEFNAMKKEKRSLVEDIIESMPFDLKFSGINEHLNERYILDEDDPGSMLILQAPNNSLNTYIRPYCKDIMLEVKLKDNYEGSWKYSHSNNNSTTFTNSEPEPYELTIFHKR